MSLPPHLLSRPRVMMPLHRRGLTGVLFLGRYNQTSATPGLSEHSHRGAIEVCFLVKGVQTYRLGERDYRMQGGDVFFTLPEESHSTGGRPQEKGVLYWMILAAPARPQAFLNLPPAQAGALHTALKQLPQRLFRGSWKIKEHLDAITSLYAERPSLLNSFAMATQAGAFLLEVIRCGKQVGVRSQVRPLKPSLDYIAEHLDEPLTVSLLAAQTRLSVARFKARFKQDIGVPPAEYVLRARIKAATSLLQKGDKTITQIAYELGFSSSQYFATVYKRFTGLSPSRELARIASAGQIE